MSVCVHAYGMARSGEGKGREREREREGERREEGERERERSIRDGKKYMTMVGKVGTKDASNWTFGRLTVL